MEPMRAALIILALFAPSGLTTALDGPIPSIVIPVRIHLLQSARHPNLRSRIDEPTIRSLWTEVDSIWSAARIRFEIRSIDTLIALDVPPKRWLQRDRNWVKSAVPMDKLHGDSLDLCFVHEMGPNGFYYGEPVVVSETPSSYKVRGGARDRVARVVAHELGHALTLQHRDPKTALMASGSTGTDLNEREIQSARKAAEQWLASLRQ